VNYWKVILATMVIFGAGVVTGGLVVRHSGLMRVPRIQREGVPSRPAPLISAGVMRLDFLRRVQKDLDLNAEQRIRADEIIRGGQERTRKLMEPLLPQLREEAQKTREQFRAMLSPAQQTRFDELLKKGKMGERRGEKGAEQANPVRTF